MRLVQFKLAGHEPAPGLNDVWVDADSVRTVSRDFRMNQAHAYRTGVNEPWRHQPEKWEVFPGRTVLVINVSTTKSGSEGIRIVVVGEAEEVVKKLMGSTAEQLLAERIELQRRLVQVDAAMEKVGG